MTKTRIGSRQFSTSDRLFTVLSYAISGFFVLLIAFPILYAISLSFMDLHQMTSVPPRVVPRSPKQFSIVVDYSGFEQYSDYDLEDLMRQEATLGMYLMLSQFADRTVGRVDFYGLVNDDVVFHAGAHARELQVIWISGLYRTTNLTRKGLLRENRYGSEDLYRQFTDQIGFAFERSGLEISQRELYHEDRSMQQEVSSELDARMELSGSVVGVSYGERFVLAIQNYFYYNLQIRETYADASGALGSSELLKRTGFLQFFLNTVLVVLFAVFSQITITPITAYPLSRLFGKKLSDAFLLFFLGTNFIPFVVIMIPQFRLFQSLGLTNTYWGLFLPHLLPFGFYVYLYKAFFDKIPSSLFDAARIDGAGEVFIFSRILIPLSRPIYLLVIINTTLANIVDFFWAWLITENPSLYTMNVALYNLSRLTMSASQSNMILGLAIFTSLPVIIAILLFSRKIKTIALTSGLD